MSYKILFILLFPLFSQISKAQPNSGAAGGSGNSGSPASGNGENPLYLGGNNTHTEYTGRFPEAGGVHKTDQYENGEVIITIPALLRCTVTGEPAPYSVTEDEIDFDWEPNTENVHWLGTVRANGVPSGNHIQRTLTAKIAMRYSSPLGKPLVAHLAGATPVTFGSSWFCADNCTADHGTAAKPWQHQLVKEEVTQTKIFDVFSIFVKIASNPPVNGSALQVCQGEDVTLTATTLPEDMSVAPEEIVWSNGKTGKTITEKIDKPIDLTATLTKAGENDGPKAIYTSNKIAIQLRELAEGKIEFVDMKKGWVLTYYKLGTDQESPGFTGKTYSGITPVKGYSVEWTAEVSVICKCGNTSHKRFGQRIYRYDDPDFQGDYYTAGGMPVGIPTPTSIIALIGEGAAGLIDKIMPTFAHMDPAVSQKIVDGIAANRPKNAKEGKWLTKPSPCEQK